jgi:hypothetical protein
MERRRRGDVEPTNRDRPLLSTTERVGVLVEEYRVLYSLVTFRMTALDRRVVLAWAAVGAFLASYAALGDLARQGLLLALPLAVLWLNRTTVGHAKSFEDVLRRIDEIERMVNRAAGEELLAFQSRHPSRGRAVGGRTGEETVRTVYATSIVLLTVAGGLQGVLTGRAHPLTLSYAGLACVVVLYLRCELRTLARYIYEKRDADTGAPLTRPA